MRVLAWVPQVWNVSPGQRFRIEQWAPHLAARGIEIEYQPFAGPELSRWLSRPGNRTGKALAVAAALGRRLAAAVRGRKVDLAYVFREDALLGPALAARLLALRGVPFVFDFDDAVFLRYVSPANGLLSYLRFPSKTATLCNRARHVLAGNTYLEAYARRFSDRVSVIPTTIDTDAYRPRDRALLSTPPVIGWSGSFSTVQHLAVAHPALEALARRRRFRLRVVGGEGVQIPGVDVECRPWRAETEIGDISSFDIGLMPLPDDVWARGKCGLKALQYMALGIPAVASPVGVNAEIVEHGRNGLLASTTDEWLACLDRLLADVELGRGLGAAGRRTVEERYSASVVAPRVARIFEEATENVR